MSKPQAISHTVNLSAKEKYKHSTIKKQTFVQIGRESPFERVPDKDGSCPVWGGHHFQLFVSGMADSKVHLLDRLCRFTRQERETEEIDYDPEDAATMDMLSNDEKMKPCCNS